MSDYLTAYRARMERNDKELKELAVNVLKADSTIEVYFHKDENKFQDSVVFFKEEQINFIGFHEVPYRWSGCGFHEHSGRSNPGGENSSMPFTVDDVLNTFHSVTEVKWRQPNEYFKSKEQYLKWSSYLKRWENDKS